MYSGAYKLMYMEYLDNKLEFVSTFHNFPQQAQGAVKKTMG
jgi:hypothetical protein